MLQNKIQRDNVLTLDKLRRCEIYYSYVLLTVNKVNFSQTNLYNHNKIESTL